MSAKILVVEDRDNLRQLLVKALSVDFAVDEARDGASAIEAIQSEAYAVVLSDVKLPGPSGDDILAVARSVHPPPEVVLMTAFADVSAAVAALKAGAYDYLPKPFEPELVVRVVGRAAERYRLLRRTAALEAAIRDHSESSLGLSPAMRALGRQLERI